MNRLSTYCSAVVFTDKDFLPLLPLASCCSITPAGLGQQVGSASFSHSRSFLFLCSSYHLSQLYSSQPLSLLFYFSSLGCYFFEFAAVGEDSHHSQFFTNSHNRSIPTFLVPSAATCLLEVVAQLSPPTLTPSHIP